MSQTSLFDDDLQPDIPVNLRDFEPGEINALFLTSLVKGDAFKLGQASYSVVSASSKQIRLQRENGKALTIKIVGASMFGNAGVQNFFRDLEGAVIVDFLNENNTFHEESDITQRARKQAKLSRSKS